MTERAEAAIREMLSKSRKGAPSSRLLPGRAVYVHDVTDMSEEECQAIKSWFEANEGHRLERVEIFDGETGQKYVMLSPVIS